MIMDSWTTRCDCRCSFHPFTGVRTSECGVLALRAAAGTFANCIVAATNIAACLCGSVAGSTSKSTSVRTFDCGVQALRTAACLCSCITVATEGIAQAPVPKGPDVAVLDNLGYFVDSNSFLQCDSCNVFEARGSNTKRQKERR